MSDRKPNGRDRLAALVALLAFVAAAVLVVVSATANVGALLLTLLGLVAAVLGSWHLLTRRGPFRIVAGGLAVGGVAVVVLGLVWADLSPIRMAAALLLALVAAGSARLALHKPARPSHDQDHGSGSASAGAAVDGAAHPVLIMNLKSGGGKAEQFHLVDQCRARGIESIVLTPGDDLLELAEDAVARGADVLGMAGGDGSQALVASVAARHDLPYVVVPAGTRNHFALDLGLDRGDVVGALDAYASATEHRIDLATVNGRVFVNNATLGLYAKIVQSPEYRDAKRQTTVDMLPDLLGPEATGPDLRFTGPDGTVHLSADVILVSNNPYELRHFSGRGTRERLDRGTLGIATATIENAAAAAQLVTLELAGQLDRFPGWEEWGSPRFEIDADGPVEIAIDGEALRMDPPLVFEIRPLVLRVRVPHHAPGRSPAARALHLGSRSTLADLARLAFGHRSAPS